MTHTIQYQTEILQDRYGLKIAARLSEGANQLPPDISERLRFARTQALARRKVRARVGAVSVLGAGGAAVIGGGDEGLTWWSSIASALPLVILVFGLLAIQVVQSDNSAHEIAVVDVALLTDDLPPQAYADPGFAQFLKSGAREPQRF